MTSGDWPELSSASSDFHSLEPQGRVCLEVCHGSACREVGNVELLLSLERLSGRRRGQAAKDGGLVLKEGFCQGRCAIGPNVRLNNVSFSVAGPGQAQELLKQALKMDPGSDAKGEPPAS